MARRPAGAVGAREVAPVERSVRAHAAASARLNTAAGPCAVARTARERDAGICDGAGGIGLLAAPFGGARRARDGGLTRRVAPAAGETSIALVVARGMRSHDDAGSS